MPKADVVKTQKIASVCIHIERAIGHIKAFIHIFDHEIPFTLFGCINQMLTVCCLLTNFTSPLIADKQ